MLTQTPLLMPTLPAQTLFYSINSLSPFLYLYQLGQTMTRWEQQQIKPVTALDRFQIFLRCVLLLKQSSNTMGRHVSSKSMRIILSKPWWLHKHTVCRRWKWVIGKKTFIYHICHLIELHLHPFSWTSYNNLISSTPWLYYSVLELNCGATIIKSESRIIDILMRMSYCIYCV